ncbi:MAG: hypothetical protein ACM3L6_02730 [Deltaproteobacteria bacterium]
MNATKRRSAIFCGWVAGLAVVVTAAVSPAARAEGEPQPAAAPAPAAEEEAPQAVQVPNVDLSFRDPFRSFLPFDQDLFRQAEREVREKGMGEEEIPEEEVLNLGQFDVAGLVWGVEQARAIINGKIYGVGDVISDATIVRIDRKGILFEYKGREYQLPRA